MIYGFSMFFLHWCSKVGPVASFCSSLVFLTAWIAQFSIWTNCDMSEITDSRQLSFCSKWPNVSQDGTSSLQYARFAFSMLCIFGHAALLTMSAVAARRARRDEYGDHVPGRKRGWSNDSSFRSSLSFDGGMTERTSELSLDRGVGGKSQWRNMHPMVS